MATKKQLYNTSEEKKYLVETPVKDYCGISAGVHFAHGKATIQGGWICDWFMEHDYKVTEVTEEK